MPNRNPFGDLPEWDEAPDEPLAPPLSVDFTTLPLGPVDNPALEAAMGYQLTTLVCPKCGKIGVTPGDIKGTVVHEMTLYGGSNGPAMVKDACLIDPELSTRENAESIIASLLARLCQVGDTHDVTMMVMTLLTAYSKSLVTLDQLVTILAMVMSSLGMLTMHPDLFDPRSTDGFGVTQIKTALLMALHKQMPL